MLDFFGLAESPFIDAVDVRMFYMSDQHRACLAKTLYCISEHQPLGLIVGPFGTGKSLVLSHLYAMLRANPSLDVVHIQNPASYPTETALLQKVALELGLPLRRGKGKQMSDLMGYLIRQAMEDRSVVLIVDESQNLGKNVGQNHLELLREFSNFDAGRKLITTILVGQPELLLRLKHNPALESRVAIRSTLAPLDAAETRRLIDHRVAVAGREAPLFTPEAYDLVQRLSGGLPRRVNQIGWNALPIAAGRRETTISAQSVREAGLTGLGIEELQYA
ncbi:MAG: peptidoglycan-binding domain 1 [Cyanobacteria bacterium RYN_339]|nr:peptidoglycan-binding domain 1 [Cyanobacteria bacterium RYN_339]